MSLTNRVLVAGIPLVPKPIVGLFSRRYIAGEKLEDAVRVVRELNRDGMMATLDVLGEEVKSRDEARAAAETYKRVLATIQFEKLDANVSVKLTQMGLKLDPKFCREIFREVVREAQMRGNFVRIDMEDSACTDETLAIYGEMRLDFSNVGIALQAYLRRTVSDVDSLMRNGKANFRLCKGIYVEPRLIAYRDKELVNRNFTLALERMLQGGAYVGIATHDERLVWEGMRLVRELGLSKEQYEFQMLLGVDVELRKIILAAGHRLRIYVPFGDKWYPYSMRRLRENPQIARYVLQNLFHRA
ncbi:MAG: proline dehydrogenase [Calditrichaeota bacterium]|nr:proline dehydrogenase [Calditrichota bacterium]